MRPEAASRQRVGSSGPRRQHPWKASAPTRTIRHIVATPPSATCGCSNLCGRGGRLVGNLSRAEARLAAAEGDLQDAKQQLALRVIQAWSEALVAQMKLQAYEGSLSMHVRLLELVRRRHAEGASAQADVALASSRLSTLQSEHDAAKAQRDTARERLRLLTESTRNP